ncbi:hypothetical protein Ahy_A02g005914 isoform E [Arachis hypogaea]|nr:hypothetical protein Ahy_A02g005914 isoform E [Arachis hypogaea]
MPKGMNKLKDLQFLSDYVVGKNEENGIGELGELANLHGTFYIQKLENVISSVAASDARMDEKIHLNDLSLKWSSGEDSDIDDSQVEKDVLDKLRPHKGLKKLKIEGFRGTMLPDWVAHSFYNNMTFLELRGCKNCWMVPSLGQLPSLMELRLDGFDMVKIIGAEFYKSDRTHHHHHQQTPFRSLKYLFISHMRWWEAWESLECDDAPFPQLKQLSIWECPKLRGDLPAFLPSLKSLYIEDCEQLGCYLPRASIIRELRIYGKQEARMQDLPLSLQQLSIEGNQLVESVFEAMTRTQPTSITGLWISNCSSAISFPGNSLPSSLKELGIMNCKNMEFPMQQQHHHESLVKLTIENSCVSLTSMVLEAFPNLTSITIKRCENLRSLEVVPQSQSLEILSIEGCPKMENIAGERLPASLRKNIEASWSKHNLESKGTLARMISQGARSFKKWNDEDQRKRKHLTASEKENKKLQMKFVMKTKGIKQMKSTYIIIVILHLTATASKLCLCERILSLECKQKPLPFPYLSYFLAVVNMAAELVGGAFLSSFLNAV